MVIRPDLDGYDAWSEERTVETVGYMSELYGAAVELIALYEGPQFGGRFVAAVQEDENCWVYFGEAEKLKDYLSYYAQSSGIGLGDLCWAIGELVHQRARIIRAISAGKEVRNDQKAP